MRLHIFIIAVMAMFVFSTQAFASTSSSVSSPVVTKDKTSVEFRTGYSLADKGDSQDNRLRTRVHIDHGFTNFYAARLIVAQDKRDGNSYEHDEIALENRFYFLKADDYGFDFGSKFSFALKDGDKTPHAVKAEFYERIPYDAWEFRLGQLFSHDVGQDAEDGLNTGLRMQATYAVGDGYRAGLESFSDFGNINEMGGYSEQSHTFGPVLKGKLFGDYSFETGYRAGVSRGAPDHSFKFFVGRSF